MTAILKLISATSFVIGLVLLLSGLVGFNPIFMIMGTIFMGIGIFLYRKSGSLGNAAGDSKSNHQSIDASGFTYQADNIAIDVPTERVWLRDVSGTSVTLNKGDILRWRTDAHVGRKGFLVVQNDCPALVVDVRNLDRPQYVVAFSRFRTGNITNVYAKNELERDEWYSRLTTFINAT